MIISINQTLNKRLPIYFQLMEHVRHVAQLLVGQMLWPTVFSFEKLSLNKVPFCIDSLHFLMP